MAPRRGGTPSPEATGADPDPAERVLAEDLARRVREAVATLAPGQRDAVLAFYWRGLSHIEAAAELGVSPGAVKARLHQARAALAPRLDHGSRGGAAKPQGRKARERRMVDGWIAADVVEVRRSAAEDPRLRFHAVVLKERDGPRRVPIFIGGTEATALALALEAEEMPRPMTYAMAAQLAAAAGSRVVDVRITNLADHVVYAVVRVDGPTGPKEVDARPSDALNLALACGAPVLIDSAVFASLAEPSGHDWEAFLTGAGELVVESRTHAEELMAAAWAGYHRSGCGGAR